LRVWTCRFSGAASDRAAPRTAERDASCCVVHSFTRTGAHGPVRPCRAAPTRAEPSCSVRRARHQTPCGGKLDVLSSGLRCAAGARPPHAAGSNAELSRRWRARHGLERQWPWPQCSRFFLRNGRSSGSWLLCSPHVGAEGADLNLLWGHHTGIAPPLVQPRPPPPRAAIH
jgi:hypothetical protein